MGKTQKSIERIRNIGHILKFNTLTANPKCKFLLNALKSQEWENSQYDLYIIPIFLRQITLFWGRLYSFTMYKQGADF